MIKKQGIAILIGLSMFCVGISYYFIDTHLKENTWETKTKTGIINELILYNHFPNTELFISFVGGDALLITQNHLNAYSYLSQIDDSLVEIKYKENGYHWVYVLSAEVVK